MTDSNTTKTLLACGITAAIVYIGLALLQIAIRPGFDVTRHSLSIMANGDLGWIQTANFLISGVLTVLAAFGLRRATRPGKASFWGSLLVGIYGLGIAAAAFFPADPALGFPPGTPDDQMILTTSGIMHFAVGGVAFLCLIAANFVFARLFAKARERGWAIYSVATGVAFFAAFFGIAAGAGNPVLTVGFYVGVAVAWCWIAVVSAKFRRTISENREPAAA